MVGVSELRRLLDALDLTPADGGFVAEAPDQASPAPGGHVLAQVAVAACRAVPGAGLRSLHTVFARRARPGAPVALAMGPMRHGRGFASATVTVRQGDTLCSRSIAMLHHRAGAPLRHARHRPDAAGPQGGAPPTRWGAWDVLPAGLPGGEPSVPATGPAEPRAWVRVPGAPPDAVLGQALVAYAGDGFLCGTADRRGEGPPGDAAGTPAAVVGQTIAFHEPVDASQWLLLARWSPSAGGIRSLERADVWAGGALVASVVQDRATGGRGGGT